jgi:peptidyl-Asp metalloendopeptidase
MKAKDQLKRASLLMSAAVVIFLGSLAQAQTRPNLFRQRPTWTTPSNHGLAAQVGDVDHDLISAGPAEITIAVPGQPDLVVERDGHTRRGARSSVWRGRGQHDRSAKATLTQHEGLLFGHIESGNESFIIRPGPNGRTIVEKLDTDSFPPEWGHDPATYGREKIPPPHSENADPDSSATAPVVAGADGTIQIDLMSVYTPQARAAAGGTAQIQGRIQAAVDQANTAFINSQMIVRFFLAHTAEVSRNDSGNIESDLNWLTSNSTVASWRNTYAADMVSLITNNGGGYCGIGWVQRNPAASFASHAFQVTALGCLANSTLAHEHGHNMGMEHDPASAGVSSSGASYPWSFGHNVNGVFRTIMSYNVCSSSCPRVLHFSNPDVLYGGYPTGLPDQRDNAHTGDLTAATVAAFRSGSSTVNVAPVFTSDPITKPNATQGQSYSATLSSNASDSDLDPLTFAKTSGPTWLSVASNGALAGTPGASDAGINSFTVSVADGRGGSDTATLEITVVAAQFSAPSNLVAVANGIKRIDLSWSDNSTNETGFRIERASATGKFSHLVTVGANVMTYSNTGLRRGKMYRYRVRANSSSGNSVYSNIASARSN